MNETAIQKQILNWLKERGYFCWRNQNMPTRGRQNLVHVLRGMPDICILERGFFIGLEVKVIGGKIGPEQIKRGDEIAANGGIYLIVRSLQEVVEALTAAQLMRTPQHLVSQLSERFANQED